jgi:hypothetical protein
VAENARAGIADAVTRKSPRKALAEVGLADIICA